MASPFGALLEPLRFVLGLFVVGMLQKFVEFLGDGKVSFLFGRINGQLRHPVSQHVLRVGLAHPVSVGLAVHSLPPAIEPAVPGAGVGLAALVEGVGHVGDVGFGDGAEVAEEERHVHLGGAQQVQQVVDERFVGFLQCAKAQLFGPGFALGVHGEFHVVVQHRLKPAHVVHQRGHGFEQTSDVPGADVGLVVVAVASATRVGGVGRPVHVEGLEPAVGAVVDGQSVNRHVVRVHDAVNEADPHPVGDHRCRGFSHFGQPCDKAVIGAGVVVREVVANGVVDEGAKRFVMAVGDVDLEAAEADETGRDAADHGSRLRGRVAVVEDVSNDRFARGHQRQGTGGGHAEVMHRFAAQEFADGGAQHGLAVGGARIGRQAGTFELQFKDAVFGLDFAQRDGTTVAQLAGPVPELVAAVALGVGLHAGHGLATPKHDACFVRALEPQHLSHLVRPEAEAGFGGGRGLHP